MAVTKTKQIDRTRVEELWSHLKNFFVALGVFTPFAAFYKALWPSNPKAEIRAVWISIALAALTFGAWELWLATENARLRRFFGLRKDKRLLIALPSWTTDEGHTVGKKNYESNLFETRSTRRGPGTSQLNLDTLTRVVDTQPALRKLRPEYKLDETLFSVDSKSPSFLHDHHDNHKEADVTIVSYGASSSNHLCRYVLSQPILSQDPQAYHFLSELNANQKETDYFVGRRQNLGPVPDSLPARFDEADGYDYALLIRLTIQHPLTHGRRVSATVFVCAGLDRYGSEAALEYLFKHWRELDEESSGRDFYYLCRVSEHPLQLENFILRGIRAENRESFVFEVVP